MNARQSQTDHGAEPAVKRAYVRALCCSLVGWVIGVAIIGFALGPLEESMQPYDVIWSEAIVIAISSGVIAVISMLPPLLALGPGPNPARSESETINRWGGICSRVMAGTLIRAVGTVALFLTCRYHMASTTEIIAVMTIGWYLLLTSIEVCVLVRAIPKLTKTSRHFDTPTPVKV